MGRIQSVSVATSGGVPLDLSHGSKVLIDTDQDVRIAYDSNNLGTTGIYFIIRAGTTLILDPPNPFSTLIYLRADSTAATVRTWVMGGSYH